MGIERYTLEEIFKLNVYNRTKQVSRSQKYYIAWSEPSNSSIYAAAMEAYD